MGIKVLTDSTCYIPREDLERHNIEVISLSISFNDDEIHREVDITNEEFYRKMEKYDVFPKSSQPSIQESYEIYEKHIKNGDDVVGIFLSSEMSGTYASACMIKGMILENYPHAKIEIIDSRSNCMQLGYSVLTAAKASEEGKSFEEVVELVKGNLKRGKFIFCPDTLDYLKKGGRIGTAGALVGNILQIKPVLTVKDGKTTTLDKVRTKKKALKRMIDELINDSKKYGLDQLIVHHINCKEEGEKFAEMIRKFIDKDIKVTSIGPVIGTHVGPGALGIVYCTKDEIEN